MLKGMDKQQLAEAFGHALDEARANIGMSKRHARGCQADWEETIEGVPCVVYVTFKANAKLDKKGSKRIEMRCAVALCELQRHGPETYGHHRADHRWADGEPEPTPQELFAESFVEARLRAEASPVFTHVRERRELGACVEHAPALRRATL